MVATATIAFLAGAFIVYSAVRMMKSREFIVSVNTARWNPQGRMYVKLFGLHRWVNITRKVVAPALLVVGFGLCAVAVRLAFGQGK